MEIEFLRTILNWLIRPRGKAKIAEAARVHDDNCHRRVLALISPRRILEVFQDPACGYSIAGIPEDAVVQAVHFDFCTHSFEFAVSHPTFDIVADGAVPKRIPSFPCKVEPTPSQTFRECIDLVASLNKRMDEIVERETADDDEGEVNLDRDPVVEAIRSKIAGLWSKLNKYDRDCLLRLSECFPDPIFETITRFRRNRQKRRTPPDERAR